MKSRRVRLAAVGGGLTAAVLVGVLGFREHALARFPGVDDPAHPSGMAPALDPDPRWTPVYVDDFTGTSPDGWYLYSGAPSSGPGGFWSPSHDIVQDGVLHLRTTYENGRWVSGGLARTAPKPLVYGKIQVRFRMAEARGVSYALLMWPDDEVWPPEIDFGEDGGGDRTMTTATLHHGPENSIEQHQLSGDFSQWHTLGIEWTPGRIDYLVDGHVWATDEGAAVPSVPMHLALQTQTWDCGLAYAQCPDSTTPAQTDLEVDWVTVQGYTGG
ncbi:MAG: family 16 glycosylhydrolase [Frankiales bacterium]|nr:family 16 glycosylhydrolase [Frankiales bacterium]